MRKWDAGSSSPRRRSARRASSSGGGDSCCPANRGPDARWSAHAGGVASGQAASLYLFAYYLGSSVFGSVTGQAWTAGGWPGVVALSAGLFLACGLLALWLRTTPSLDPRVR